VEITCHAISTVAWRAINIYSLCDWLLQITWHHVYNFCSHLSPAAWASQLTCLLNCI